MTGCVRSAIVAFVGLIIVSAGGLWADAHASDSIWLISTRTAPTCRAVDTSNDTLKYWRLDSECESVEADFREFLASDDPDVPTVIFIHGNRMKSGEALQTGIQTHQILKERVSGRPFRFVIWSWPSDRVRGRNRQDARAKASRSDADAFYLARCLGRVDPAVPVSLIGYSFGARVITGAMHILDGGQVAGRKLPKRAKKRSEMRAILVAAALDADWLLTGHRNGRALNQLDRLLVTINTRDPVMKYYPLMYGRGGPQALGHAGPACIDQFGDQRWKVELTRVSHQVGDVHAWERYSAAPNILRRLARFTFLNQPVESGR